MKDASIMNRHCAKRCTDAAKLLDENRALTRENEHLGIAYARLLGHHAEAVEDQRRMFLLWQASEAKLRALRIERMDLPVQIRSESERFCPGPEDTRSRD